MVSAKLGTKVSAKQLLLPLAVTFLVVVGFIGYFLFGPKNPNTNEQVSIFNISASPKVITLPGGTQIQLETNGMEILSLTVGDVISCDGKEYKYIRTDIDQIFLSDKGFYDKYGDT